MKLPNIPDKMFDYKKLKDQRLSPSIINKAKYKSIPPLRTLPLSAQMELSEDLPTSIIEVLSSYKPTMKLKQYGIPSKAILAPDKIDELCFISSYFTTETPNIGDKYLELLIDYKQMFFWSMAMVFKPNIPYLAVISSEENSTAGLTFAAYIANYYINLAEKHSNEMLFKWYRSLEFVKYNKAEDSSGVIIIQCRWASWVDSREKLLRHILNVRAAYENATLILIMAEEDLSLAPYLLNDEPFGLFLKIGKKEDVGNKPLVDQKPPINKIMDRIKRQMRSEKPSNKR